MDQKTDSITDQQSESVVRHRGRPAVPPARVLAAADALFAEAGAPGPVTMDAVAVAAGVGKGTLFRAFGSREGLLDALWAAKLAALRGSVQAGASPLGPGTPPRQRIAALMEALLAFKLDNRRLIQARERSAGLFGSGPYRWAHALLQDLIGEAAPEAAPGYGRYAAHALLAALHLDVVEELIASGLSPGQIRHAQAAHVLAILDGAAERAQD